MMRGRRARLIIGLMSGTSVDGIDAALVRIGGRAPRLSAATLHHTAIRWPRPLRERILAAMAPAQTSTQEICQLQVLIAEQFAKAVEVCLKESGTPAAAVAALACHGQTVCHLPPAASRRRSAPVPSTLQLGDPSVLATLTGIPTVGNFRPADMAAGGQGAPLVPWTDDVLLSDTRRTRCVQNIGGIANVTYLPPRNTGRAAAVRPPILAFDTGPGNMLIDALVTLTTDDRQTFDRNGRIAARGTLHRGLFEALRAHPYIDRRPPKTTGREDFGMAFARQLRERFAGISPEDLIHTATRFTAWSIADAYLHFLPAMPDEVILCGGGADNPVLVGMLEADLAALAPPAAMGASPSRLQRIDHFGIPNKAKEAVSFALLAAATLDGVPGNVPSVTGARQAVVLGVIARPCSA